MNYQNAALPEGAEKVGSTKLMNQETVVPGILKKHLAQKGKWGYIVVESGTLQFVWEDDPKNVIDATADHPIVIYPERFHHVIITGEVQFQVEFYLVKNPTENQDQQGDRPGEAFV